MRRRLSFAALMLAAAAGLANPATASDLWLHVRVDEPDHDARVVVNLPLAVVDKALPMLDLGEHLREDSIHLNGKRIGYQELRDLWLEVRDGPDMAFVTVEERGETVRLWKENGFFHVRARDRHDDQVDVRMPLEVVDALIGARGTFDVAAALAALADRGEGELVSIEEEGESVRVWVDRNPESSRSR